MRPLPNLKNHPQNKKTPPKNLQKSHATETLRPFFNADLRKRSGIATTGWTIFGSESRYED